MPVDDESHVTAEELEAYVANLQPKTGGFAPGQGAPPPPAKDETAGGSVNLPTPPPTADSDLPNDGLFPELADALTDATPVPESDAPVSTPEGDEGSEGEGESPASPPPDSVEIAPGRFIPRAQLEAFQQFDDLLRSNPELGTKVHDLINGGAQSGGEGVLGTPLPAPSPPTAPTLPELDESYYDDPAIKALYDFAKSTSDRLSQYDQRLAAIDSTVNVQVAQENEAIINRVTESFKTSHQLTDAQIQSVSNLAGSLNILPALLSGKDPQSGLPVTRDRAAAVERALEIAYWQHPELREVEYSKRLDQRVADARRKQKLAGVSGSSGSVPRSQPVPTNPRDLQRAAVRELSEMMGVNSDTE